MTAREGKLAAARYWLRRAEEAHQLALRYEAEAARFGQFARDALHEAGQAPGGNPPAP